MPPLKTILTYLKTYYYQADKTLVLLASCFMALLIFFNYFLGADDLIRNNHFVIKLLLFTGVFALAFVFPYWLTVIRSHSFSFSNRRFRLLLFLAPWLFALKITVNIPALISYPGVPDTCLTMFFYWPSLMLMTACFLWIIRKFFDKEEPFYGIRTKGINWKPYFLMLLLMIPLIALAATQADFLAVYPKYQSINSGSTHQGLSGWKLLLFELSYGTDFLTIEFFFRGFLVLGFIKWAGRDAILPMACFYCSIHFGKPLGECISSYFGGLILGIVVWNTRSVWGGLIVHLGIAWLMELGGYLGNWLK